MNTPRKFYDFFARLGERVVGHNIKIIAVLRRSELLFMLFISVCIISYSGVLLLGIGNIVYTVLVFLHLTINLWPEMVPVSMPFGFIFILISVLPVIKITSNPGTRKIVLALAVALCCATGLIAALVYMII